MDSNSVETLSANPEILDDTGFIAGYYLDGDLKSALFNRPVSGAVNSKGDIFIADSGNNAIRLIKDGKAYTYSGSVEGYENGGNINAKFNRPMAMAIDKTGNIYVADTLNNCIRKIDLSANTVTVAGVPQKEGYADGLAKDALFNAPSGIAVSEDGIIYVSDTGNHRIRKIENGNVSTIAGFTEHTDEEGAFLGGFKDGVSTEAQFNLPMGLTISEGVLIIADSGNNKIRALTISSGNVIVIAGNGEPGDKDGGALEAMLHQPMGVHYNSGILYIADTGNNKIKKMPFEAEAYE